MTSRVSSKNKEKKAKRKNNVKKKRDQTGQKKQQQQKNGTKKQETASPEVEPGLSARASDSLSLHHSDTHVLQKLILSYENNFSLP